LHLTVTVPANTTATLYVPTAGKGAGAITENGRPVSEAPGIRAGGIEGDRTVLHLGAGEYTFVVKGAGKPGPSQP
jgi:hypothetical protein